MGWLAKDTPPLAREKPITRASETLIGHPKVWFVLRIHISEERGFREGIVRLKERKPRERSNGIFV